MCFFDIEKYSFMFSFFSMYFDFKRANFLKKIGMVSVNQLGWKSCKTFKHFILPDRIVKCGLLIIKRFFDPFNDFGQGLFCCFNIKPRFDHTIASFTLLSKFFDYDNFPSGFGRIIPVFHGSVATRRIPIPKKRQGRL